MITAIDSNVLLDVLTGSVEHGAQSAAALRLATSEGALITCTTVLAEVVGAYDQPSAVTRQLERLGLDLVPDDRAVALAAGRVYRAYRKGGGARERILPDFLIGAHAAIHADRLLTRDRGFYRSLFAKLKLLEPVTAA